MKKVLFEVPQEKRVRVIIDSDCACEADDQFAIVHALMSPKLDIVGICASHFADRFGPDSEGQSYDEIKKILTLADSDIKIYHGAKSALTNADDVQQTEATDFIIKEALKDDPRPLFIAGMAALTNVASALLIEPKIADKITLVWIGGGSYPNGESEFNLENDVLATNVVLNSAIELWQVPKNVFSKMYVPLSFLYQNIYGKNELGTYLVKRIEETCIKFINWIKRPDYSKAALCASYPGGEMWILSDSPAIALILFDEKYSFHYMKPREFKADGGYGDELNCREIRVYDRLDKDFIVNDFIAKFQMYFAK